MLNIFLGTDEEYGVESIHNVSGYFDLNYETEWLNSDLAKRIIKGIDLSDHIKDNYIESPILGGISPRDLSSGCKGVLILLNEPNTIVCGERFGNNCFEWLSLVGQRQDITITLCHYISDDSIPVVARILNNGKITQTTEDINRYTLEKDLGLPDIDKDLEEFFSGQN